MSDRSRHPRCRSRKTLAAVGALHLIDLENQARGSKATAQEVADAVDRYRGTVPVASIDHVVVATGPTLAPLAAFAWRGSRFVMGHGLDGADDALIDWVVDREWVAHRYETIYIASGDHRFAELAADLNGRGARTSPWRPPTACRSDSPGLPATSSFLTASFRRLEQWWPLRLTPLLVGVTGGDAPATVARHAGGPSRASVLPPRGAQRRSLWSWRR